MYIKHQDFKRDEKGRKGSIRSVVCLKENGGEASVQKKKEKWIGPSKIEVGNVFQYKTEFCSVGLHSRPCAD